MVQPIRPHDASGIYRTQGTHAAETEPNGSRTGGGRRPDGHGRTDSVSLSPRGRELAYAEGAVRAAPEMRAQRIAQIQEQLDGGTYRIDPRAIAQAMFAASDAQVAGADADPATDVSP